MNALNKWSKSLCLCLVAAVLLFFAPALSTAEEIHLEKMRPFHIEPRTVINVDMQARRIDEEASHGAGGGIPIANPDWTPNELGDWSMEDKTYCDPNLAVSIAVKRGDVVRVSFAGSMRGNAFGFINTVEGPSDKANFRGLSSHLTGLGGSDNEWRPFYVTFITRAYEDGTLKFRQGFQKGDFNPAWIQFKPNRIAIAEIITDELHYEALPLQNYPTQGQDWGIPPG